MGMDENKRIVQAFYEAGNRGDLEGCLALLAENVRWTNMGTVHFSGSYDGKQALVTNLLGPIFGKLRGGIVSTLDNLVAEGECVVVESRGRAETLDGRAYNNRYCHVFQVRDGQIVEVREYLDTLLAVEVLGTS